MNNSAAKIAVFYHVYQHGDWVQLVNEQLELLQLSGLYDACSFIHVGINGDQAFPFKGNKIKVEYNPAPWLEETPTLNALRVFCEQNENWKILYFHTKGLTQKSLETTDWRKVMEYFCIERWPDCIEKLNDHDTVGCLYVDTCYLGPYRYYGGNFWWSNSEYVRQLKHEYLQGGIRQNREFWIGTGNGSMYSFLNTDLNHYISRFPRHNYAE